MKVLVVEDDLILRKYIVFLLKQFNFKIAGEASSGAEAIMKADEHGPDFVIMDIVLEGHIDGIEAAERICNMRRTPILFISGYDLEDKIEGLACACKAGYLVKPINELSLLKSLIKMSEKCMVV